MAKQVVTKLLDDLDGGAAHETVRFGLDGRMYEIDLSSKNAKKLRSDLAVFVEHGSRVSARSAGAASRVSGGPPAVDRQQSRAIREWALANGYEISLRGRIKQELVDEFHRSAGR
jgi:hypothetical protein